MESKSLPKVSIVTPSYNAMQYIKETIESIHSQDYPNLEHIIFDGASSDGTVEWVKETYPQVLFFSEKDRGQSHALNKGFNRASGEIVGWLNADDIYTPGAIQKAVNFLTNNPEIDIIYTDLMVIDENSRDIGLSKAKPFDVVGMLFYNPVKQPTVFMRRRVVEKLGGVDESYHYVMDREFWLRAGMIGLKLAYLPGEIFAKFRLCKGTKSFEDTIKFRDEWYLVLQKVFKAPFFQEVPGKIKTRALAQNRSDFHIVFATKAIQLNKRKTAFFHLYCALYYSMRLVFNRGYWWYFYLALTKSNIDLLRRYKKQFQKG